MATQNNKKEGFGESVINWLILFYSTPLTNLYKIKEN